MIKTYYHMSSTKLPIGKVLIGQGRPLVDPSIEDVFEKQRPKNSPSRLNSVYMTDDRDFKRRGIRADDGYVHQVEAIGPVEKRDNKWVGELELRLTAATNPPCCEDSKVR